MNQNNENIINGLVDINKSLVRICNNIELVTALLINDTLTESSMNGNFEDNSKLVIKNANSLKDLLRNSRRENKIK
jgi:hypothetical protein